MKQKTQFVCQQCGQTYGKWAGKCNECGEWNSLVEERVFTKKDRHGSSDNGPRAQVTPLTEVTTEHYSRWPSDLIELDTVLGGGLVPGSAVLIGGEPGVGKSTLLLQAAHQYAKTGKKVLYVSGEESTSQIGLRSQRLKANHPEVYVLSETHLENIQQTIESLRPNLLILDSIQTVYSSQLESQPGSVGQLRECSFAMIELAKQLHMATFLVGHVTKEGSIAGPKVLEHMVDVVLYFESTTSQNFRMLRSMKNRFGSTNEVGVFELSQSGLKSVANPSELFLAEKANETPGSVIASTMEGSRSLLVEVQALVSHTSLAMPRRTAIGLDPNRVSLLVAILERRAGYRLFDQDVFVNIAGGLKLSEPALDLAVAAALISSFSGKPVMSNVVFFGEIGLGGEVRSVTWGTERLREASRIGLGGAFIPTKLAKEIEAPRDVEIYPIKSIQELSDRLG